MSEEQIESEHEGDETPVVKTLRDKVKELETQLNSKADVERQLAFVKAGVDVDSKAGTYFYKAYDGELDAEAIKAEAAEIGLIEGFTPAEEKTNEGEARQTEERSNLSTGADTTTDTGENPKDRALRLGEEAMKAGATTEDAVGEAFGALAFAAYKDGDERATFRLDR